MTLKEEKETILKDGLTEKQLEIGVFPSISDNELISNGFNLLLKGCSDEVPFHIYQNTIENLIKRNIPFYCRLSGFDSDNYECEIWKKA